MKSQTKALLASVMVLALALSSIGGVTYSWFSDVENTNFTFGTASVDINTELEVISDETDIPCIVESDGSQILIESNPEQRGSISMELTVTNNSSIPVDVTAKVIIPRYTAILVPESGNWTFYGEVYPVRNSEGNITSYTNIIQDDEGADIDLWDSDETRQNNIGALKFGKEESKLTGKTIEQLNSLGFTHGGTSYSKIRFMEYSYTITNDLLIEAGSSEPIPLKMKIVSEFHPEIIPLMYIQVGAVQSDGIQYVDIPSSGNIKYDVERSDVPLIFSESNIRVAIEKASLINVKTIELTVTKTGSEIDIQVAFRDDDDQPIDPDGNVKVHFSYADSTGMMSIPASSDVHLQIQTN